MLDKATCNVSLHMDEQVKIWDKLDSPITKLPEIISSYGKFNHKCFLCELTLFSLALDILKISIDLTSTRVSYVCAS